MTVKDLTEAFRKALVDVLVPEIKTMQGQLDRLEKRGEEHSRILQEHGRILQEHDQKLERLVVVVTELKVGQEYLVQAIRKLEAGQDRLVEAIHELRHGQEKILSRLDLDKRVTRLETLAEESRRGPAHPS